MVGHSRSQGGASSGYAAVALPWAFMALPLRGELWYLGILANSTTGRSSWEFWRIPLLGRSSWEFWRIPLLVVDLVDVFPEETEYCDPAAQSRLPRGCRGAA
ncbi:MAG: hypothetical protein KatS3mg111_0483 [Pirellulaceae bacterium]|nr:MAG: hypothetical protein KatS3mg111_0483 [Pirellulaceae bacterium]